MLGTCLPVGLGTYHQSEWTLPGHNANQPGERQLGTQSGYKLSLAGKHLSEPLATGCTQPRKEGRDGTRRGRKNKRVGLQVRGGGA